MRILITSLSFSLRFYCMVCKTCIEEQAAEIARKVSNLSDQETSKVKSFNRGYALFLMKNYRIHAKFEPAIQEKEMFDTTPMTKRS